MMIWSADALVQSFGRERRLFGRPLTLPQAVMVTNGRCRLPNVEHHVRISVFFFFQAEDGIRDLTVTGVQTCALPIYPPFDPSLEYEPEKAVGIAQELNADSLRYPAASYYAYFPNKSGYPIHPQLKGDPMRQTLDLCRRANLKNVAYVPLNHPFMEVTSKDPRFADWAKKFADGRPMITEHYGFAKYYEGCLNSPVRDVIKALVREVLVDYPFDVMYFDGPYQGMQNAQSYCHCIYCDRAYRKTFNKPEIGRAHV